MRIFIRAFCAAATAAALATPGLAGAGAASAAPLTMGPPVYVGHDWGGYRDTGRSFRFVSTTVTVPNGGHGAFIMLDHVGPPGASAEIDVSSSPGHLILLNVAGFSRRGFAVHPKTGDLLTISIYYDRFRNDRLTANDITQGVSQTLNVRIGTRDPAYDRAELAVGGTNIDAVAAAAPTRLWKFTRSHMTTYRGNHGSVLGPWTTQAIISTTTGTKSGKVVIAPSVLWDEGQNFGVWQYRQ